MVVAALMVVGQSQPKNLLVLGLRSWALDLSIHLRPPTLLGAPALALGRPSPQSPASSSPLQEEKALGREIWGLGSFFPLSQFVSLGKLLTHICESGHSSHFLLAEGSRETPLKPGSEGSSLAGVWCRLPGLVSGPEPCAWAGFLLAHPPGHLRIQPLSSDGR